MGKKIAGTCYFSMDGEQLELAGKITADLEMVEREGQVGLSGVAGFTEKPKIPMIELECFIPPDFPREKVTSMTSGTMQVELANGWTGLLEEAWFAGPFSVDGAAGTVGLKFEGVKGKWI